mgnify:CR=1 FL=1
MLMVIMMMKKEKDGDEKEKEKEKRREEGQDAQTRTSNNPNLKGGENLENESPIHVLNHHATYIHTDMRSNAYEDAAICFCESLIRITQSFQRPPA